MQLSFDDAFSFKVLIVHGSWFTSPYTSSESFESLVFIPIVCIVNGRLLAVGYKKYAVHQYILEADNNTQDGFNTSRVVHCKVFADNE